MEPYPSPPRDTPEQNQNPESSRAGESDQWVRGFRNIAMDLGSAQSFMSLARENASSVLELVVKWKEYDVFVSKQIVELEMKEERLRVVEERQKKFEDELDVKQFLEVNVMRLVLEMQNEEVFGLAQDSLMKKHEELMREVALFSKSVDEKEIEAIERMRKETEMMETKQKDLSLLNEIIKGKSSELKKKEEELKLKEKELSLLDESIKEKLIELEKKEEEFQQESNARTRELEEKEKELEEKEFQLKQRELKEQSPQIETGKRSRLQFESSLLAEKDRDAYSLIPIGKRHNPVGEHSINDVETKEACVLHVETSSVPVVEAKEREVNELVCVGEAGEDPESFDIPDPQFKSFSNTIDSFSKNQIWALYDPIDAMPRYYARVKSISKPTLSMKVTWLESVHNTAGHKLIPIACGRFRHGTSETKSLSMFSHQMYCVITGKNVFINPRKGDTWALFRDWTNEWNTHREQHKPPYRYDFVEVLSDFDKDDGIGVAYLGKVEGFTSVYERAAQHGVVQTMISPAEMFRFSHRVPSRTMTGDENNEVPAGSFELDTASIPRVCFESA